MLSSENSSKLVFKPKYYKSIFLNNNIIYNSFKDNLKNDQETNLIHNVNNFLHRKKNKTFNRLNYSKTLNGKIYHRLLEKDSEGKLIINCIHNFIRNKF